MVEEGNAERCRSRNGGVIASVVDAKVVRVDHIRHAQRGGIFFFFLGCWVIPQLAYKN